MTEPKSATIEAPGAVLHYDVRANDASTKPVLLVIGSPMAAPDFAALAGHLADRTVVTYDPRGAERSKRTDGATENRVEEHADDLHRLISALGTGPVDVFASSGGAVNALALVARHPEQVRTLVAHEPPATVELPDGEVALAVCEDIAETYRRSGFGPAMAKFIKLVMHQGEFTKEYLDEPAPDPAMFGLPAEDDGTRDDPLLALNMMSCNGHRHDFEALRNASTRIVIGVGAVSGEGLPARAGRAVAAKIGTEPVEFPGDHGGFMDGEHAQAGDPAAFAAKLREVLDAS
jgi:pimeloyl-ACP methyl ester carboxylesterase